MSKNNKELEGKETVEIFRDLDKTAINTEKFLEKNVKPISIGFGVVLLGILGYFAYQTFVVDAKNGEATLQFLNAQKNQLQNRDDLAIGGKSSTNLGFSGTYKEYSGTNAGKLSAYNLALIEYKKGAYQKAYDDMNDFDSDNKTLMALKHGVMGDCAANLNKTDEALSHFDKAISTTEDPSIAYHFTKKAGLLALAIKNNDKAKSYFKNVEEKYLDLDMGQSDSYIEMVKQF